MRMRAPLPVVVLGLTVLGLATGCQTAPPTTPDASSSSSVDGSESPSPTAATNAGVKPACTHASAAVVKSTLGMTVSEPSESFSEGEIDCTYAPANGGLTVVVKFRTDQDAASFARARLTADTGGEPTTDVMGIGDEAYVSSEEFGDTVTNTLIARQGSIELLVAAPVSIEAEKAFATKVFSSIATSR